MKMDHNDNCFVFTEIVRCGIIGRVAFETFHQFHTRKLHIFGRQEDFHFIVPHPNNVFHILEEDSEIVKSFNSGHRGTSMVWTKAILECKEKYLIHIDSDVVFRGNIVDDIAELLKTHDLVGTQRNYKNNPHKERDDVRHLPDCVHTFCFGFNRELIYVKEPDLLARLVENSLDYSIINQLYSKYPNRYTYLPTIDFFDPVSFIIMKEGGNVIFISNDIMGNTNNEGTRINKYGILNTEIDFGDKIAHFASVGSGLNFLNMKKRGEKIDVPEWYVDYAVGKLDLYMRLFYKTKIMEDSKNKFLNLYPELSNIFSGLKLTPV